MGTSSTISSSILTSVNVSKKSETFGSESIGLITVSIRSSKSFFLSIDIKDCGFLTLGILDSGLLVIIVSFSTIILKLTSESSFNCLLTVSYSTIT